MSALHDVYVCDTRVLLEYCHTVVLSLKFNTRSLLTSIFPVLFLEGDCCILLLDADQKCAKQRLSSKFNYHNDMHTCLSILIQALLVYL